MFRDAGWTDGRTVGSHTKWHCPASKHSFSLPDGHRTISPGVYSKAMKALDADSCLPDTKEGRK